MNALVNMLTACGADIVSSLHLSARDERVRAIPSPFREGATGTWLSKMLPVSGNMWSHQALALQEFAHGKHVVVETGTASGKSLIFQSAATHQVLTRTGRSLVLYPLKALSADQLGRWRESCVLAGISPDAVGEINGDVPMHERERVLKECPIVIATPDSVHSWVMPQVGSPLVREFLAELRLVAIDEAHVYESEMGSNAGYLFRRLRAARNRVVRGMSNADPLQFIAATATIGDASEHMAKLTGLPFATIGEDDNGAPSYPRELIHIDGPTSGRAAERMIADLLTNFVGQMTGGTFIAFHDSRQGVERICKLIDRDDVLPYRSGYEVKDRQRIADALKRGTLKGVVATSALELGIDVHQFVIGFNVGVPRSRKSFLQRVGRVGRHAPGVFVIIAPPQAFAQFGSTLEEFYRGPVETAHLYLENRHIQFAQARCLLHECELVDGTAALPQDIEWPTGFPEMFAKAHPDAYRPRELELLHISGGDSPHRNYPLRKICQAKFELKDVKGTSDAFGEMTLQQAIREGYPGATYLHLGKTLKVREWKTLPFDRSLRLQPVKHAEPTSPMIYKKVRASLAAEDIVDGHLMCSEEGLLAEVHLQVTESVVGYSIGSTRVLYSDLRKTDPRMRAQHRSFTTTGVILQINADWFTGTDGRQLSARKAVGEALRELLIREEGISSGDVDFAETGIAICNGGAPFNVTNGLVFYDTVEGSLRLTKVLFEKLPEICERLALAADVAGDAALLSQDLGDRLSAWLGTLEHSRASAAVAPEVSPGEYLVYAPGSEVSVTIKGVEHERRLGPPQLMTLNDTDVLVYPFDGEAPGKSFVAHDKVIPIGNQWRQVIWNSSSDELRELAA